MLQQWKRVVIDWINCLGILKETVTNIQELKDGLFYKSFLNLSSWKPRHNYSPEEIVLKFLEDKYPSFKINKDDNTEHIYIATLLMMQTPAEEKFHYQMCNKLCDDTQIRIKIFFETVLPLGRNVIRETMQEVLLELEDNVSKNLNEKTPLKNFLNSPAYSIRSHKVMTERNREIKELRNRLDLEQFKNADLQEDLRIMQSKVNNLQEKIKEQSIEVKTLREEQLEPSTPQSTKKEKENLRCENYKKFINRLESQLLKQQDEMDILEADKEALIKKLTCLERQSGQYKKKMEKSEKSFESLSKTNEIKDRELVELRMNNEELRAYIKEINKNCITEQSFEVDEIALSSSVKTSFNTSEVLSPVIEIQLQEAKEETAVLHAQVDSLKEKLDIAKKDYITATELNSELERKVKLLNKVELKLDNVQKELISSKSDVINLQTEKLSLIKHNENLQNALLSKEKILSEIKQSNDSLNTELSISHKEIENLKKLVDKYTTVHLSALNDLHVQIKDQETKHLAQIDKLTEERNEFKFNIEQYNKNFKDILRSESRFIQVAVSDLDNMTVNNFTKHFETILHNYHTICASHDYNIKELKTTIEETKKNLLNQQLTISTLEEQNKQHIMEISNITQDKKQTVVLLNEQKEAIHNYLQEIEILKDSKKENSILEENLHKLQSDFISQQLLMKSAMTYLKDVQYITKQLTLMKKEIQQEFTNYQTDIQLICEKINNEYKTLHCEVRKEKQEKEKLKHKFDNSEEQLSNAQTINVTLQQNLLNNREIINTLEEKVKNLCNELSQSKQHIDELKQVNRTLKEQQISIKIEANNNTERMKSENAKISVDLQNVTDKLNLLQQETYDTVKQVDLKNTEINQLLLEISSLKSEKEHLIHLNEQMYEAKVKEMQSREEELISLQNKMEELTYEAKESERKMKEVIINLQEVRSGQDAVLATQETALKEKHLHIEELRKEFDKSKEILNKQITNEKSLQQELQTTIVELKAQIHIQNNNVDELQEKLKVMSIELESSKDHCQILDASQAEIVKLCQELEHPTKNLNSTIMETCSDIDVLCDNLQVPQYNCMNPDNKNENILNIIKMTLDELRVSQKVILHLSCANNEFNKTLDEQNILLKNNIKDKEEICDLKNKVRELESVAEKRNEYLNSLVKNKTSLKVSLQKVFILRDDLNTALVSLKQKWDDTMNKFPSILHTESSVCDEFKQLQARRIHFEDILCKYRTNQLENIKFISDMLWEKFLWTEQRLNDTYLCSIHEKECLDILTSLEEDQFSDEKMMLDTELEKNKTLYINILKSKEEIESFITLAESYENSLKSGEIMTQSEIEKKFQVQINKLAKEKKDLTTKLDNMRSRNVKLERNIDELRIEIKKVQSETVSVIDSDELQSLQKDLNGLKEENQQLRKEKDESSEITKQELENQLKDVHTTYERKLEDVKQKMKVAYNEQITKINDNQERNMREKLHNQMELMCQKHREEINRYKAHVSDLTSQLWEVGEKLLIEQQQKNETLENLKKCQTKFKNIEMNNQISTTSNKISKMEKRDVLSENKRPQQTIQKIATRTEEGFERRHCVRNIQAMGNIFKTEDEEEIFDNVYLADIKKGNCLPTTDVNRLSILQMRNSLCKPHLKSSYPAEMQFLPLTLTEEDIKTGSVTEDIFNDSLSQSLLPEQKPKKKDRSQTSYKKPGPPTPSKNGGRLSLQGNELKSPSSHSLRDRNIDRRTTVTPRALRNLFTSKRQDEGTSTPKGRRLSNLFRKPR